MRLDILEAGGWQMSAGERAALTGLLVELRPKVAIEIGTGNGGTLKRLARHASEVHAFDLNDPTEELEALANVTFHVGDSHLTLPKALRLLEDAAVNVDFALVDGDHSSEGVRRDVGDLLGSTAVEDSIILLHDTANPLVREGLDAFDYESCPKVSWVDLDWVPGFMFKSGPAKDQAWGGLGLVLVDAQRGQAGESLRADYAYPLPALLASWLGDA